MNCKGGKQTPHGKTKMQRVNCYVEILFICPICLRIVPEEEAEIQMVKKITQVVPNIPDWMEVESE